jgi:hypothetical protein
MNTVSKGSIYSVSSSSPLFQTLLQGWKENMSTPGSKIIQARIDWTERNNLLPVLILGVKADKIRYAAHGGSEDIQFISLKEFNDDIKLYAVILPFQSKNQNIGFHRFYIGHPRHLF